MSISAGPLADAPVAGWKQPETKKTPPKRVTIAVKDTGLVPEPR
jgi:hypothetical protein